MTRKLRAFVHVAGVVYGPGDVPPADVAARITNPGAWEEGSADEAMSQAPGSAQTTLPQGASPVKNATGKPEAVLTPDQSARAARTSKPRKAAPTKEA